MNEWVEALNMVGVGVSAVSVVVAVVQTLRKREVEKALRELRRTRRADTWTNIGVVTRTFDTLDEARDALLSGSGECNPLVLSKISSARRGTVDHWRHLLKQAILDEPGFCQETIERWAQEGKLENPWRISQARRLLDEVSQ